MYLNYISYSKGVKFGEAYKKETLALTAGAFMYLAISTLMPEILKDLSKHCSIMTFFLNVICFSLGVGLMYQFALYE